MNIRYRVGPPVDNFGPPHAVLDDQEKAAIALCWSAEKAQLIADALNDSLVDLGELEGPGASAFMGGMLGSIAGAFLDRKLSTFAPKPERPSVAGIPKKQQHVWKELHGLGGGYTCTRCKKRASECYDRERFYCQGPPQKVKKH